MSDFPPPPPPMPSLPDPVPGPGAAPSAPRSEEAKVAWWKKRFLKLPVWAWIVIGVVLIGAAAAAGGSDDNASEADAESSTTSATESTETTTESTAVPASTGPSSTAAPSTAPPPASTPAPTTPPPPTTATPTTPPTTEATTTAAPTTTLPLIDDGVWLVPAEVAPGIYRVGQYWATLDAQQEIIDNDLVEDCFSIMVLGSDASYVEIHGQAVLAELLPGYDPIAQGCTDGTFLVGSDIAPGQYRVNPSGGSAYWARLDSNLQIIDNDLQDGQSIVVVDPSDFALRISGTLERIG